MKKSLKTFSTIAAGVALLSAGLLPAFAQTVGLNASAGASITTTNASTSVGVGVGVSAKDKARMALISTAQTRADKEITRRIAALNALSTRVNGMVKVSADEKTALSGTIAGQISLLNTLQTQIATDASSGVTSTLKTDIQSITKSYRIFALIIPQGAIAAASDRVQTIAGLMNDLGAKLQARIAIAQGNGVDVTAMTTAYTDMTAKIADSNTKAQAAVSTTASLQPDNGDATIMASNTAALKAARTDITTAQSDLTTARKDSATIIKALVALGVKSTASSTVSASASTTVQ